MDVQNKVRTVYNEFRTALNKNKESIPDIPATSPEPASKFDINLWRFGEMKEHDELDRFLEAPLLKLQSTQAYEMFDPMKWWRGNEEEYPTLVAIAYDIFAV